MKKFKKNARKERAQLRQAAYDALDSGQQDNQRMRNRIENSMTRKQDPQWQRLVVGV